MKLPVFDVNKHYWVGDTEIQKLKDKGGKWLRDHPYSEEIIQRYLINLRRLTRDAIEILLDEQQDEHIESESKAGHAEQEIEKKISFNKERMKVVSEKICGMNVSNRELKLAKERLKFEDLPDRVRSRLDFTIGSAIYKDDRFSGYDAITLIEVIEHIDENRLLHLERSIFEYASPNVVIVTTPNFEYNVNFENLSVGAFRHGDHRFEWTRRQFETWASAVADKNRYKVSFSAIGPIDDKNGSPTQMGVFEK